MTNDKGIPLRNVFYMLCYAYQALELIDNESVKKEDFKDIEDLFAGAVATVVAQLLKQGLYREYVTKNESLPVLRGKLMMPETIRNKIQRVQKLACEFDELSENNLMNQILKTTMYELVLDKNVKDDRKSTLKYILGFFSEVKLLDIPEIKRIKWNRMQFQRNNKNYELLMRFICEFVLMKMLLTTESGDYNVMAFKTKNLEMLYQRFVRAYYEKHHSGKFAVESPRFKWNLTDGDEPGLFPEMKTDITLRRNGKTLIIDTKYCEHELQKNFDKFSLRSAHVNQIYAYVKNMDKDHSGNVAGLLLYAKTQDEIAPDTRANADGNIIGAKTLDLNKDFSKIQEQLDDIVKKFDEFFDTPREATAM